MRVRDNGGYYTVNVSVREIAAFAATWPCCTMPRSRGTWFQFSKANGDLVDMGWRRDYDGAVALSEDAGRYGAAKLGILEWRYPA